MVTVRHVLKPARYAVAPLQARLACEDVLRASFRLIDQGQATRAADLYAVDGTLTLSDATKPVANVTLRGADIHAAMRQREAEHRRTLHVLTPLSFRLTAPDEAESECHLQVYGLDGDPAEAPSPRALSHVQDVLARDPDGAWRISARRITILAGSR
jgi:hypothetical protein